MNELDAAKLRAVTPFRRMSGWTTVCSLCSWSNGVWRTAEEATVKHMAHHQRCHFIERVTHYLGNRCPGGHRDDVVEEGHGLMSVKCGPVCDLQVVSGVVQCSCPHIDGN